MNCDHPGKHDASPPADDHASQVSRLRSQVSSFLIFLVVCYRYTLGRFIGGHCRFHPTCSQYMIDAIHKHGPFRGAWRGLVRIARCHPWGGSGYDPA